MASKAGDLALTAHDMQSIAMAHLRYISDSRQTSSMLAIMSILGIVGAAQAIVAGSATLYALSLQGLPITSQNRIAVAASFVSMLYTGCGVLTGAWGVMDGGNRWLTRMSIFFAYCAWFPFMYGLVTLGLQITGDLDSQIFVPQSFDPSQTDVNVVGGMAILSSFAYAFATIGGLCFFANALLAFQSGNGKKNNASFYKGRMFFYSFLVFVAGASYLTVGAYTMARFGAGKYILPVFASPSMVADPVFAIIPGALQALLGMFGMGRSVLVAAGARKSDNSFIGSALATLLISVAIQVLSQSSFNITTGMTLAATAICSTISLMIMPTYLDYKMRMAPVEMDESYYSALPAKSVNEEMVEVPTSVKSEALTVPVIANAV